VCEGLYPLFYYIYSILIEKSPERVRESKNMYKEFLSLPPHQYVGAIETDLMNDSHVLR
jgi:hypothetical protein